jgi:hypothetical protein
MRIQVGDNVRISEKGISMLAKDGYDVAALRGMRGTVSRISMDREDKFKVATKTNEELVEVKWEGETKYKFLSLGRLDMVER